MLLITILITIVIGIVALVIPGTLTIWNIYNSFSAKPKKEKLISSLTVLIGGILYMLLHVFSFDEAGDWYEQVNTMQFHNTLSSEQAGILGIVIIGGFLGYFILLFVKVERLPPFISVISISFVILLNVFQIIYAIQIYKNSEIQVLLLFYVYHLNLLILSARVIRQHMLQQVEIFKNRIMEAEEHKEFTKFLVKIDSLSKYTVLIFIALFFVIAIIEIIFVLAGQGIDAPIRAFTDTADWTFSKQIPPPPLEHQGHYLCTVAAGGHKKVVKPLRLGTRRGKTIVVNRQLCIANAFEELISEKFPLFHKKVRHAYDTYGYPLSKLITNEYRADIIYFMMKPLEWIFLLFLYLVDLRPEQRINRQYIGQSEIA